MDEDITTQKPGSTCSAVPSSTAHFQMNGKQVQPGPPCDILECVKCFCPQWASI